MLSLIFDLGRARCFVCGNRGRQIWDITSPERACRVELCADCQLWSERREARTYSKRRPRAEARPSRVTPGPPALRRDAPEPAAVAADPALQEQAETMQWPGRRRPEPCQSMAPKARPLKPPQGTRWGSRPRQESTGPGR